VADQIVKLTRDKLEQAEDLKKKLADKELDITALISRIQSLELAKNTGFVDPTQQLFDDIRNVRLHDTAAIHGYLPPRADTPTGVSEFVYIPCVITKNITCGLNLITKFNVF